MWPFNKTTMARLNLVHEGLADIPNKIVKKYGQNIKELDLSYNSMQYPFDITILSHVYQDILNF